MTATQERRSKVSILRRQRFQLGELRRQMYRNRRFRECIEAEGVIGRAPDYIGVGVQRAGTTRWHSLITDHPDVAEVTDTAGRIVKEIHWFDQPLADELDSRDRAYLSWFQNADDKVIGEFTPRYLYDLWPIDRLRTICPEAKLIVFLRDPIRRLQSGLQHYSQRGIPLGRDALRESIWRGMYGSQLEYLFERWPRDQVHVSLYENCNARPEAELARLYRFLDLDPSFVPEGLGARHNGSKKLDIDGSVFATASGLYEGDREKLRRVLPDTDFSAWNE